jgi:hypothetical protein
VGPCDVSRIIDRLRSPLPELVVEQQRTVPTYATIRKAKMTLRAFPEPLRLRERVTPECTDPLKYRCAEWMWYLMESYDLSGRPTGTQTYPFHEGTELIYCAATTGTGSDTRYSG